MQEQRGQMVLEMVSPLMQQIVHLQHINQQLASYSTAVNENICIQGNQVILTSENFN